MLRPVGSALLVGLAVFAGAFGAFWIVLLRDDPDNPASFYLGLAAMSYSIALVLVLAALRLGRGYEGAGRLTLVTLLAIAAVTGVEVAAPVEPHHAGVFGGAIAAAAAVAALVRRPS